MRIAPSDPDNQCAHPAKPEKPYTDKKVAVFITEQSEVIDECRVLLGHGQTKSE